MHFLRMVFPSTRLRLWLAILAGISAISCASILVRLAEAPPIAIATYRVTVATMILLPYAIRKGQWKSGSVPFSLLGMTALSGTCLALHFAFWITSLQKTTVASSTTLVSTTPIFVALFSRYVIGERLTRIGWIGIGLTFLGSTAIAGADLHLSQKALIGDLFALAGAISVSGYLLAGKVVRRSLDLATYTVGTYGISALVLLLICYLTSTPLHGFSTPTYTVLILLAIIPQLIGHTTFNWALRFLSSTTVAVLILGEPIGATILAYFILDERISISKGVSLLVLGTGIALSSTEGNKLRTKNQLPGNKGS